jgi:CRP-like cAMP-binding protein
VVVEREVEIRAEGYGADQTVSRVGPGELFGDQGAPRGQRGVFTAHAVTQTVRLAVERETMRDLLLPDQMDGRPAPF